MSYGPPPGPPGPPPGGYGPPHGGQPMGQRPEVGLAGVIFSLLCCWPLGIPALVFQMKIDNLWSQGDYHGAQEAADKAKKFRNLAFILGITAQVLNLIVTLILVLGGAFAASTSVDTYDTYDSYEYEDYGYDDY